MLRQIIRNVKPFSNNSLVSPTSHIQKTCSLIQKRNASYGQSKLEGDPKDYTKYEITKDPEEWRYVERLLPIPLIPKPKPKDNYPSGWQPQTAVPGKTAFFVERTKNHMLPVYLDISVRGMRKITKVRNVSGDIWDLSKQLTNYLNKLHKREVGVRVDEVSGKITYRGDYFSDITVWLRNRNF